MKKDIFNFANFFSKSEARLKSMSAGSIQRGDEVIIPGASFDESPMSGNQYLHTGNDPGTKNLSPEKLLSPTNVEDATF